VTRSQVDNAQVRDGPAGPWSHPVEPDARVRVLRIPGVSRSRGPVRRHGREAVITFRISFTTVSNALTASPGTGISSFPGCPSLSQPPPGPAQTPGSGRQGTAPAAVPWPGLSCGDRGTRCAHSYTEATQATGTAGTEPQQPQQRHSSRGAGNDWRKRRRAPPGGRAVPARTVRPWGGRPVPSLSVAYPQSALVCDHQYRFPGYWRRIRYRYPLQRQPSRITTYAEGSEKGLSLTCLLRGRSFSLSKTP
jgi:hypothetical protein